MKNNLEVKPLRRKCIMCKKRRVIKHHYYCHTCWKIINSSRINFETILRKKQIMENYENGEFNMAS